MKVWNAGPDGKFRTELIDVLAAVVIFSLLATTVLLWMGPAVVRTGSVGRDVCIAWSVQMISLCFIAMRLERRSFFRRSKPPDPHCSQLSAWETREVQRGVCCDCTYGGRKLDAKRHCSDCDQTFNQAGTIRLNLFPRSYSKW